MIRTLRSILVASLAIAAVLCASTAEAGGVRPNVSPAPLLSWQVVAPNWTKADKELGRVDDILRVGKRIFIGGNFTVLANHKGKSVTRTYLAVVKKDGSLGGFHAHLDGRVYGLASSPSGKFLYVAGMFTHVNGRPRAGLCSFNLQTNRLVKRVPNLHIRGGLRMVAATRAALYIGGSFRSVTGKPRAHLAKLVLRGRRFVLNKRGQPSTNGEVRDIVVDAVRRRVYVGGTFTVVNARAQSRLTALGARRGKITTWHSHPQYDILDIALCGNRLYAAEGGPGGTALAYTASTGHRRWYYKTDGNVQAVAVVRKYPVFGMHGDNVAPKRDQALSEFGKSARIQRHKAFMLSPNGTLMTWNPDFSSTAGVLGLWALRGYRGSVYAGGDFTGVHGVAQQRFAILPGR